MSTDPTQIQGDDGLRRAQELSLQPLRPPTDVPGYESERFLGAGAYGEVWVAIDRNTGRRVAIKFYAHRGGLDWTLLSREVEKLVLLSADRYVVQLLDVGWEAEPPYFVMEYLERGSLDERLKAERVLSVSEAVGLFREVAIGLQHAHGKGVLHCDLKPANVLLDQDTRPRLADFGQSRLSHEQAPALGTLFFMAPEQADLKAVPDARWDVYALGALLYTMLTGIPPHRSEDATTQIEGATNLDERLARYRQHIEDQPAPEQHRHVPGMDRGLAEIVDRCLAVKPDHRYPNVQAVLDALHQRDTRRTRSPLVVLGLIGPVLMMLVMGLAAWWALEEITDRADAALTARALEGNQFAAQLAAKAAANDLDLRFRAVQQIANDEEFKNRLRKVLTDPELESLRDELSVPLADHADKAAIEAREKKRKAFQHHPSVQNVQQYLDNVFKRKDLDVASWFTNDGLGLQIARAPPADTVAKNYSWRTYFHGDRKDQPQNWRPPPGQHIRDTTLSAMFRSQATGRAIIGVSAPVYLDDQFAGVIALTSQIGDDFGVSVSKNGDRRTNDEQFAVLVDARDGKNLILQHPLIDELLIDNDLPDWLANLSIDPDDLPLGDGVHVKKTNYTDPVSVDEAGKAYQGLWLAEIAHVDIRDRESGLLVIVQERKDHAIGRTLDRLQNSLFSIGLIALAGAAVVLTILWVIVARALGVASSEWRVAGE